MLERAVANLEKTKSTPLPSPQEAGKAHAPTQEKKQKRTPGLKWFDVFLYPFLTNFCVFVISVVATYLTSHGSEIGKAGSLTRKIGQGFQVRGEWMLEKFKAMGMGDKAAKYAKIVFFSFADGTLIAPLVKLLEDRREKIARWIDIKLGTKPKDESVYAAEPKQSWMSVILGRLAVVSVVVPTALLLNATKPIIKFRNINPGGAKNLNDLLFNDPGLAAGKWVAKKPGLAKLFGKLNIPELFSVSAFEAFYTSVCTAGLYFGSRFIARITGKKTKVYGSGAVHGQAEIRLVDDGAHAASAQENLHADAPSSKTQPHETTNASEAAPLRYRVPPATETHLGAVKKQRERGSNDAKNSARLAMS